MAERVMEEAGYGLPRWGALWSTAPFSKWWGRTRAWDKIRTTACLHLVQALCDPQQISGPVTQALVHGPLWGAHSNTKGFA